MTGEPTYVTRPFLPPLSEFLPYLETIWQTRWLTNAGPFHERLEAELAAYLGVPHLALFNNGTIALIAALKALDASGEVITTPYSFAATAHCLLWNNLEPVFVDIDPATCNIDPDRLEAAITPRTTAILPVHCYGTPCDVRRIAEIAERHGLRLIYDAAHAFGVRCGETALASFGDLSILSFHATKVFHTFEGGAVVCPDTLTKKHIDHLKNFGIVDETHVVETGLNGKMNEVQAAIGLAQLPHMDDLIRARVRIDTSYRAELAEVKGIDMLPSPVGYTANGSYFPIFVRPGYGRSRDELYDRLKEQSIFARRYFHPLISDMPMYRNLPSASPANLPNARKIADSVLCLPIYPGLSDDSLHRTIDLIKA